MHTAEMSDRKQEEGRPRSPGIAPVAVKVEEGAISKPLPDGFNVDREKVVINLPMVCIIWNLPLLFWCHTDLSHALASVLQYGETPQSGGVLQKLCPFKRASNLHMVGSLVTLYLVLATLYPVICHLPPLEDVFSICPPIIPECINYTGLTVLYVN